MTELKSAQIAKSIGKQFHFHNKEVRGNISLDLVSFKCIPTYILTDPPIQLFLLFRPITDGNEPFWVVPIARCLKRVAAKNIKKHKKIEGKVQLWKIQWLGILITGHPRTQDFINNFVVFLLFLRRPVWDIGQWGRPKMAYFHQLLVWTVRKVGWGGLIWLIDVLKPGGFLNFFYENDVSRKLP